MAIDPLIPALLRWAAAERSGRRANDISLALRQADDATFQWIVDAGLGPMLYRAVAPEQAEIAQERSEALLSADMVAQVLHGGRVATASEIVRFCSSIQVPVTLLKGISISEQHYDAGHCRPMTDIDLLVGPDHFDRVEKTLVAAGYRPQPVRVEPGSHHGTPLFHPAQRVWVEIHTALFRTGTTLGSGNIFSERNIAANVRPACFDGQDVFRLTNELQLAYVASYWCRDMCRHPIHPTFVIPLLDAVKLANAPDEPIDWDVLLAFSDVDFAKASLYVVLTFLQSNGLAQIPREVLHRLHDDQTLIRKPELKVLHLLIARYLLGGRGFGWFNSWHLWSRMFEHGRIWTKLPTLPWNLMFPPSYAGRFDWRFQLQRHRRFWQRKTGL